MKIKIIVCIISFSFLLFCISMSINSCKFYGPTALVDVFELQTDQFYLMCEFKVNGDFVARAESGGYGEPPDNIDEFRGFWDLTEENVLLIEIVHHETVLGKTIMTFAPRYKYEFPYPDLLVLTPLNGDSESGSSEISLYRKRPDFK